MFYPTVCQAMAIELQPSLVLESLYESGSSHLRRFHMSATSQMSADRKLHLLIRLQLASLTLGAETGSSGRYRNRSSRGVRTIHKSSHGRIHKMKASNVSI